MKIHSKISRSCTSSSGFTLVELLVAIAITGIVITASGFGLVNILQANKRAEAQTERRIDLNRALDFIADDIREAQSVSKTKPSEWTLSPSTDYTPIFYIKKPNSFPKPIVAYYTRSASGVEWRGPLVIYRSDDADSGGSALIDAISDTAASCTSSGTASGSAGFKVYIDARKVKICLKGKVSDSETYSVETNAFARSTSP